MLAVIGLVLTAAVLIVVALKDEDKEDLASTQSEANANSGEGQEEAGALEDTDPTLGLTSSSSTEEILTVVNPCPSDVHVDRAPFSEAYPRSTEWAYLESRTDWLPVDGESDWFTTVFNTETRTVVVSGRPGHWQLVDWGLRDPGVRVLFGLKEEGSRISSISFELDDGRVFFPGLCREGLNRSLVDTYGPDVQVALADVRSLPLAEAQEYLRTGGGRYPDPLLEEPVIVNPSTVSEEVLNSLQFALVVATIDEVPEVPSTICTKSTFGWGDCFQADTEALANGVAVDAYLNGSGLLEFWLTDESANLTKPIRLLGSVRVPVGMRDTEDGVAVSVDIKIAESTVTERRLIDFADLDPSDPVWGPLHQD